MLPSPYQAQDAGTTLISCVLLNPSIWKNYLTIVVISPNVLTYTNMNSCKESLCPREENVTFNISDTEELKTLLDNLHLTHNSL